MRGILLASLAIAVASFSCREETATAPACDRPEGCLRADRVEGTCQCLEWQLVSIEPVPVKYVVVGVVYPPLGNQSMVSHGYWDGTTEGGVTTFPPTASDLGSRWRSLVRAPDGSERVATLGPLDVGHFIWGPLVAVTGASAALVQPSSGAMGTFSSVDVPARQDDQLLIWINPAVAVATDYAGGRSVAWSSPGGGADVFIAEAGELDGTVVNSNPYIQAILDTFDAADRAAILLYDPFYVPGWDPSAIGTDPRFERVAGFVPIWEAPAPVVQPLTWTPCDGVLDDGDFPVLAQSAEVPYGTGEIFTLQHSVLSAAAACAPQHPGLMVGTSTPGCSIRADVFVDRAFGTLLMVPTSVSSACTRS